MRERFEPIRVSDYASQTMTQPLRAPPKRGSEETGLERRTQKARGRGLSEADEGTRTLDLLHGKQTL
jgi:hypothetical protein